MGSADTRPRTWDANCLPAPLDAPGARDGSVGGRIRGGEEAGGGRGGAWQLAVVPSERTSCGCVVRVSPVGPGRHPASARGGGRGRSRREAPAPQYAWVWTARGPGRGAGSLAGRGRGETQAPGGPRGQPAGWGRVGSAEEPGPLQLQGEGEWARPRAAAGASGAARARGGGGWARERAGRRSVRWRQGRHTRAVAAGTAAHIWPLSLVPFPSPAAPRSGSRGEPGAGPEPPVPPPPSLSLPQ